MPKAARDVEKQGSTVRNDPRNLAGVKPPTKGRRRAQPLPAEPLATRSLASPRAAGPRIDERLAAARFLAEHLRADLDDIGKRIDALEARRRRRRP
jgi:hypothetical protein